MSGPATHEHGSPPPGTEAFGAAQLPLPVGIIVGASVSAPAALTAPRTVVLADVAGEYGREHGVSLATLARRAGMMPNALQSLLDREVTSRDIRGLEAVARELGIAPDRLQEYRLAVVVASLTQNLPRLNALFLECLSPIERQLIGTAEFSDQAFGATLWRLIARDELTQQELAESLGCAPPALSRVMNGYGRPSVELLETIARALDTAPEVFIEYRQELVAEWLGEHSERTDQLFHELKTADQTKGAKVDGG